MHAISITKLLSAFIVLIYIGTGNLSNANGTASDRLKDYLANGYSNQTQLVNDIRQSVPVNIRLSLKHIDLNDELQVMTLSCNLFFSWTDAYMKWDATLYENLSSVSLNKEEIWTPNIILLNNAAGSDEKPSDYWPVWVRNNGKVIWRPDFTAKVYCKIDLYYWPSDTQSCIFRFGAWFHHGKPIEIEQNKGKSVVLENFEPNGQWKLIKFVTKKAVKKDDENYVTWEAKVTVKRNGIGRVKYISHSTLAVLVTVLLSYILPISFHLSRTLLHIFALSILIICDIILFLSIPNSSNQVPHVVSYYSGTIVLTSISLFMNSIMTSLYYSTKPQKILRKKISELLSSFKNCRHLEISEEVGYISLAEELRITTPRISNHDLSEEPVEISEASQSVDQIYEEGQAVNHLQPQKSSNERSAGLTILRSINIALFFIFSIAYIIDYTIMSSMISNR